MKKRHIVRLTEGQLYGIEKNFKNELDVSDSGYWQFNPDKNEKNKRFIPKKVLLSRLKKKNKK